MNCKFCNSKMHNLGSGVVIPPNPPKENWLCNSACNAHFFDGKWYTKEEWAAWIEDFDYSSASKEIE